MRFSNAAGFKQGLDRPWYSQPTVEEADEESEAPGKMFGEMKILEERIGKLRGWCIMILWPLCVKELRQVRQVERERKALDEEREREMRDLMKEESKEGKGRDVMKILKMTWSHSP